MNEEKTAVAKHGKTSLELFENIENLSITIRDDISRIPAIKEITGYFMQVLEIAKKSHIDNEADFSNVGNYRKKLAEKLKEIEKEIVVTPKGLTFDKFKSGLYNLHRNAKRIIDGFQLDGIEADKIFHKMQNEYLEEKKLQQAELKRKAEEERKRKEAEYEKRIEAAKKEETKKRLEEEKANLVTAIPQVEPKKVEGVRMVDVVNVQVTDRLLLIKTLIEAKPTPLDGFIEIDTVGLASYCKKMKLKGKEFPGIEISWSKDAQRGR